MFIKALATLAAVLGLDDPDTLTSMHNFGTTYETAGQIDRA